MTSRSLPTRARALLVAVPVAAMLALPLAWADVLPDPIPAETLPNDEPLPALLQALPPLDAGTPPPVAPGWTPDAGPPPVVPVRSNPATTEPPIGPPPSLRGPRTPVVEDAPDPADPITQLYGRRLTFSQGTPQVSVRILEGKQSFTFEPKGTLVAKGRGPGAGSVEAASGGRWSVRIVDAVPGRVVARVLVAEHLFANADAAKADVERFAALGYRVQRVTVGTTYGIAGRTVDTRRVLVLLEADGSEAGAQKLLKDVIKKTGLRADVHREPVARGHGTIELLSPAGAPVLRSPDALVLETGADGSKLLRVEHSMGYANHGHEDRYYRGRIVAVVDARGLLAAVNVVSLEELARGIVPSEIFASAHPEALKAQAITARGEVLAKIGARHVGDPYLLCAEQHCQVFRGAGGEDKRTTAAVDATRGEALFAPDGGTLVPSYYSATCGGFGEHNDVVWGGPPDRSIRGRPDFPATPDTAKFADGITDPVLRDWLASDVPAFCRTATVAKPAKHRWTRTFTPGEVDRLMAMHKVGRVTAMRVDGRGISGRAKSLVVTGTRGEVRIDGELNIRRAFKMLESGMFVVDLEGKGARAKWVFRGGGWGHGAGMCQTGAVGRAEQGATYRDILGHYFSGAEVVRIYP